LFFFRLFFAVSFGLRAEVLLHRQKPLTVQVFAIGEAQRGHPEREACDQRRGDCKAYRKRRKKTAIAGDGLSRCALRRSNVGDSKFELPQLELDHGAREQRNAGGGARLRVRLVGLHHAHPSSCWYDYLGCAIAHLHDLSARCTQLFGSDFEVDRHDAVTGADREGPGRRLVLRE